MIPDEVTTTMCKTPKPAKEAKPEVLMTLRQGDGANGARGRRKSPLRVDMNDSRTLPPPGLQIPGG